jgi:hypothetical protein
MASCKDLEEKAVSGKILRDFVSEVDQFLQDFDKQHTTLSKSQQKEVEKYQRIYFLRDHEESLEKQNDLWEGF